MKLCFSTPEMPAPCRVKITIIIAAADISAVPRRRAECSPAIRKPIIKGVRRRQQDVAFKSAIDCRSCVSKACVGVQRVTGAVQKPAHREVAGIKDVFLAGWS